MPGAPQGSRAACPIALEATSDAIRARALLRPWVSLDPDPVLFYADDRGHTHALRLDAVDLARLALSIAEAQAAMLRCGLNGAVQRAPRIVTDPVILSPAIEAKRG